MCANHDNIEVANVYIFLVYSVLGGWRIIDLMILCSFGNPILHFGVLGDGDCIHNHTHIHIYIYTYNYIEKFHGAVDTAVAVRTFPVMLARLKA